MPSEVYVIVYDLIQPLNAGLRLLGTGAFHVGVEINGKEWGYGFSYMGTGMFACEAQVRTGMKQREALLQGETVLSDEQVDEILAELRTEWIGSDYDLLTHSCCTFADLLCRSLGVGPLPAWVANLAAAGATVAGGSLGVMTAEEREEVLSKAKTGDFDQKYTVESGATANAASRLQGPNGRAVALPWFGVELGRPATPEAEEVVPEAPTPAPITPKEVQNGRGAPTLLEQRGFRRAMPATEEVAVNTRRQQKDCGCCTQ